jgi:type III secretion system YscQ/HrcQ family protein
VLGFSVGDIVMLDHFGPRPITGGPVWLRLGRGVFPGHLDGAGVTVLGSFYLRAHDMADSQTEPPAPPPEAEALNDSLLRELPVQVTCEIGRVTLSAREILELRPGSVLPVGRPLAGPVDLTAGGRVLAHGELVDVEGEIGVRITEILS